MRCRAADIEVAIGIEFHVGKRLARCTGDRTHENAEEGSCCVISQNLICVSAGHVHFAVGAESNTSWMVQPAALIDTRCGWIIAHEHVDELTWSVPVRPLVAEHLIGVSTTNVEIVAWSKVQLSDKVQPAAAGTHKLAQKGADCSIIMQYVILIPTGDI